MRVQTWIRAGVLPATYLLVFLLPSAAQAQAQKPMLPNLQERMVPTDAQCPAWEKAPGSLDLKPAPQRKPDEGEERTGLPVKPTQTDEVPEGAAVGRLPLPPPPAPVLDPFQVSSWWFSDSDGDCSTNLEELRAGTDPYDPDSDGDGWYDGPCNERIKLVLTYIKAHDEQEDSGDDEHYLIVDDIRYPHGDLDDWWDFNDGDSKNFDLVVAQRVRGTNVTGWLATVTVEGWEDDVEVWNEWIVDDLEYTFQVDLGRYAHGQTFTVRQKYEDWDYELRFRVEVEAFADPSPLDAQGDADGDGISDSAEFAVSRDFGGYGDPMRKEIFVEVDWMPGHSLHKNVQRLVATRFAQRKGWFVKTYRHQQLPADDCLTRTEAWNLYHTYFSYAGYDAFRYAVMGGDLWNDASGVAIGDAFFVDESTWWIEDDVLATAGSFLHQLGHTLGLDQQHFHLIDTNAWFFPDYHSAMNYYYQPTLVDYSTEGSGHGTTGNDHDDWACVDPAHGLQYSFGLSPAENDGICE